MSYSETIKSLPSIKELKMQRKLESIDITLEDREEVLSPRYISERKGLNASLSFSNQQHNSLIAETQHVHGICQTTDDWRGRANAKPKVVTITQAKEAITWAH